jgi:cytochrome c oxidase cbb3-type subunit III
MAVLQKNLTLRRSAIFAAGIGIVIAAAFLLRSAWLEDRLLRADPNMIPSNPALFAFAVRHGASVFSDRCSGCHGTNGQGNPDIGAANLKDADWLYGEGRPDQIEKTVTYGVRAYNSKTWNLAVMPAFARDKPSRLNPDLHPLSPRDIRDLVELILSVEKRPYDSDARVRGKEIFRARGGCDDCHGFDAKGDPAIGAPNLTDAIWLRGNGSRGAIYKTIAHGLEGICPAWSGHLSPASIREVALYVYTLSHRRVSRADASPPRSSATHPQAG